MIGSYFGSGLTDLLKKSEKEEKEKHVKMVLECVEVLEMLFVSPRYKVETEGSGICGEY